MTDFNVGDRIRIKVDLHPVPAGTQGVIIETNVPLFENRVKFDTDFTPTITPEQEPEAWEGFDYICPVFDEELELLEHVEQVSTEVHVEDMDILSALTLAAEDAHNIDNIINRIGQLTMFYEYMRSIALEQEVDVAADIYELVRDEAHTTLHLLLDYRASITEDVDEEEEEEGTNDGTY